MQTGCPVPGHGPSPGSQVGPGVTLRQGKGALGSDRSPSLRRPRDLCLTSVQRAAAPRGCFSVCSGPGLLGTRRAGMGGRECGGDLGSRTEPGRGRPHAEWLPTTFPGPRVRGPASLGGPIAFCASVSPFVRHGPEDGGWALLVVPAPVSAGTWLSDQAPAPEPADSATLGRAGWLPKRPISLLD